VRGRTPKRIFRGLVVLAALFPAVASAQVPRGFVGVVTDGPVFSPGLNVNNEFANIASAGVGRVRIPFSWHDAQPYAKWSDVPVGRRPEFMPGPNGTAPTLFTFTDEVVMAAAKAGLSLLPVVTYAPAWDASSGGNHSQPARDAPYAQYLTDLIGRYGPKGSFWTTNPTVPKVPITQWEIWNEEDLVNSWNTSPFAASYVQLLRVTHAAIKQADPSATVVLGALTNYGWRDLASIYAVGGSRKTFDAVAANAYTSTPSGVITILRNYRHVMTSHGDGAKPLLATEVGWASSKGQTNQSASFSVTEQGQAQRISQLLPLLAQNRRLLGLGAFYLYTWMSTDPPNGNPFFFSGLLRYNMSNNTITAKPAYSAFKRGVKAIEG
jgi:polysaccharide biosynthesis protein PslG